MPDLAGVLSTLRAEAHAAPGTWVRRTLGRGLELHWRATGAARADELVLSRIDAQPSGQEVTTCLAHLPPGLHLEHRLDYPERRSVKLVLAGRRCACGAEMDAGALQFGDGKTCTACAAAAKPKPKAECIDCGTQIPFDPVYAGADRCPRCAMRAGREEAESRSLVPAEL